MGSFQRQVVFLNFSMNLEEEVDNLRVQVAEDAASIHELRTCLEQEREGQLSLCHCIAATRMIAVAI